MRLRDLAGTASLVAAGNLAAAAAAVAFRAVLAHWFGATGATDALAAALQTTDAFASPLMAIIAMAFVPMFVQGLDRDPDDTWLLTRTVVASAGAALVALAVALAAGAGPIAAWMVGGGADARTALASSMIPALAFGSVLGAMAGLLNGLLQAQRNFWLPAATQPVRSLVAALAVVALGRWLDLWSAVWGLVAGFALQAVFVSAALRPGLRRSWRIRLSHPALRQVMWRMLPLVAGTFAWPANQAISFHYAGLVGQGRITELVYAMSVAGVISTLIGGSLADAAFPRLAEAAHADGPAAMRGGVTVVVGTSMFLAAASTAMLAALGPDIIALLFGHGTFGPDAVARTGAVLQVYGVGLAALVFPTVLSRVYYASGRTMLPQALMLGTLGVNAVLAPVLSASYGVPGVAAANLVAYALFVVVLTAVMDGRHRWIDRAVLLPAVLRASVLALLVYAAGRLVLAVMSASDGRFLIEAVRLGLGGLVSGAVAGACVLAGNEFGVRDRLIGVCRGWKNRSTAAGR